MLVKCWSLAALICIVLPVTSYAATMTATVSYSSSLYPYQLTQFGGGAKITVKISDVSTSEPVIGAQIGFNALKPGFDGNFDGHYIDNLFVETSPGTYQLQVDSDPCPSSSDVFGVVGAADLYFFVENTDYSPLDFHKTTQIADRFGVFAKPPEGFWISTGSGVTIEKQILDINGSQYICYNMYYLTADFETTKQDRKLVIGPDNKLVTDPILYKRIAQVAVFETWGWSSLPDALDDLAKQYRLSIGVTEIV